MRLRSILPFWRDYAPVLLAGAIMALSRRFVPLGFLAFVGLIPLFRFFEWNATEKKRSPLIAGFLYMAVYVPISLYWIAMTAQYATVTTGPWVQFGLTAGILFGVILVLGTSHAIFFYGMQQSIRAFPRIGGWCLLAFFPALEWSLNHGEFRFPWLNLGYSLAHYPVLLQVLDIGGIYLLSMGVVAVNLLLYRVISHPRRSLTAITVIFAVWIGYGLIRMHSIHPVVSPVKVGVAQPSVPQDVKWDMAFYEDTLDRLYTLTDTLAIQGAQLVVWPESSLPVPVLRYEPGRQFVTGLTRKLGIDIFTGFQHFIDVQPHPSADATYFNSATVFHPNGSNDKPYYKMALVPFGERMPLLSIFPFLWNISLGQANFEPGREYRTFHIGNLTYTPLICFEIGFPELVAGGSNCDFYVNITNDAWYKYSAGTRQHAELIRFRAIETRRTIIRAANTGFSFVTDPLGRETNRTRLFEKTGFVTNVPVCRESTLYCYALRHIGFVLTIIALFFLAGAMIRNRRGNRG
jgi:apolipoprotein N-acyltransferase